MQAAEHFADQSSTLDFQRCGNRSAPPELEQRL